METIHWDEPIPGEKCDDGNQIDANFEKKETYLTRDIDIRQNNDPNKDPRVISHTEINLSVPRTEAFVSLKFAKNFPKKKPNAPRKT